MAGDGTRCQWGLRNSRAVISRTPALFAQAVPNSQGISRENPQHRHSREGGLRFTSAEQNIRGGLSRENPQHRHSRERGNPGPFVRERLKSLDSRVRGNDGLERPAAI
ncbi:hypothetical protein [Lysobacter gummosus]|uniref:hypothetical protein n=1 Tax=Lysobacter gummosus TaxID=262324 RepID=UPI003634AAFF